MTGSPGYVQALHHFIEGNLNSLSSGLQRTPENPGSSPLEEPAAAVPASPWFGFQAITAAGAGFQNPLVDFGISC